ncbi:3550_t:CDS:2 [Diversispora eburnea]|uniref:3550_t:CDS:1 n=1 Tax=Diversispora eburnea TaxID=1213867 RepID=A0A9N8VKJ2_9GLOM|nr:3550_t:CDS:2 [Diversispora eburnea]
MLGPITQIFFDSKKVVSLVPNVQQLKKMPISGPTELGEFASVISFEMYKIWTGSDSIKCQVNEKYKNFCIGILCITQLSHVTVFVALKYIQRYIKCAKAIDFGIGRLFLISLILADKYVNDIKYSIETWAKITELPSKEINKMQLTFWRFLSYNVYINGDEYSDWINRLMECIKLQEQMNNKPSKYLSTIMADVDNHRTCILMKIDTEVRELPLGVKPKNDCTRSRPRFPLGFTSQN